MTYSRYRLLALTALMSAAFTLPALAEDKSTGAGAPMMKNMQEKMAKKEEKAAARFKKDDTNGDGFLTKDEMLAAHQKRIDGVFERLDADKDGKLSPDEMKKGRDDMREKMRGNMKDRRDKMGGRNGGMMEGPEDGGPN